MTETVETTVKYLTVPEGLVQKARNVLYFKEAIRTIMREMMKEVAKNHGESVKVWEEVKLEALKQGMKLEPDEGFSFDYITDKFFVIKLKKEG